MFSKQLLLKLYVELIQIKLHGALHFSKKGLYGRQKYNKVWNYVTKNVTILFYSQTQQKLIGKSFFALNKESSLFIDSGGTFFKKAKEIENVLNDHFRGR